MELMRSRGHEAALFSMADPRGEPTPYDCHFLPHIDFKSKGRWSHRARLVAHAVYSVEARRRIRSMIAEFRPDVAHVRNIYHHLSPSILWELRAIGVPVVYHLNDFKLLCPSYNLVSEGEICEACRGGRFWRVVNSRCYPGLGARIALSAEGYIHKRLGTYRKCVDCFLAPSQFVRDKFVEQGWDQAKFEVLPHFQEIQPLAEQSDKNAPVLYFGRLSAEKGVDDLLHAMQRLPHLRLVVAGDGPERERLERLAVELGLSNVNFAGHLQGAEIGQTIAGCRFTVLPSHAYETLGKAILESYSRARPVIASDLGSRRELVHPGKTGLLYRTGDVEELASAIAFLSARPELAERMGWAGRELVREHYTARSHYQALVRIYERLVTEKKECSGGRPQGSNPSIASEKRHPVAGSAALEIISSRRIPGLAELAAKEERLTGQGELSPRRLRVAFIGGRGVISKYSGIETCYEEVGKRLAGVGHGVTAYCRTYFTPRVSQHNGMRLVRLPTIRSKHLETVIHTFFSTLHVLTQPCDIVHYHALGPALFSFIPRLFGKKTVVTVQGLDWQRKKWGRVASSVLRLGELASVRLPSATMVVSQTLQRHYRRRYGAETLYVPNGGMVRERRAPHRIFDWDLEPDKYILFLGRFSPEKGCHLLVEAYKQLDTEVKLAMAGAASYCDQYSRTLRTHAGERVKMLDWVCGDALDELLTNAMLFVLPSDLEGLSLALLDAMGAGLCVVASDLPENREAIEDAGFTFRNGDAADLADRLRFLIANPAVRDAAGRAAKLRVQKHYQWAQIVAEIEDVYLEVVGLEPAALVPRKPSVRAVESMARQRRVG
ncbi:MAG TPA: glycosyltransferase family 4 protein [Candidatus Aquilonibacter sp.]|nr:glycosyltransferase family 4 protein [Candidatus Aquilonibacter sp.]